LLMLGIEPKKAWPSYYTRPSAPQASITMANPNRNYELKKLQLLTEFHYILFITVKSSEYKK